MSLTQADKKTANPTVACLQLNSSEQVADNLARVLELATEAVEQHQADWIVLPENAFCHPYRSSQQAELETVLPRLQAFCRDYGVWLFAGTLPVPAPDDSRVYSALHVLDDKGEVRAVYHKLHLFDVFVEGEGASYRESETFAPGDKPVVLETPWGPVGLAICYDLRFPELFLSMMDTAEAQQPMAFVVPAAFTLHTGQLHWQTLLSARALDTFSWVLAANQSGLHANGRSTYGHSAIVNPDGHTVATLAEGEGIVCATLDLAQVAQRRRNIPLSSHRRLW